MAREWTFGQKVGVGFAMTVGLALMIGLVSIHALRAAVSAKDRVISIDAQNITDAERLAVASARRVAAVRGYFLTGGEEHLEELRDKREAFQSILTRLQQHVQDPRGRRLLEEVSRKEQGYREAASELIALKQGGATPAEVIVKRWDEDVATKRNLLNDSIDAFIANGRQVLEQKKWDATESAEAAARLVMGISSLTVLSAALIALFLTRTLGRQIGSAVGQVQSSSAELQAVATQQATGAKEQATAMAEITTTIREMLVTARQIAESSQRVGQLARGAVTAAELGGSTVQKSQAAVAAIMNQVEAIVGRMLELGKKSQQIGAVLDIIGELAEQTNILAINATIESANAGESGARFAVVAGEIRRLADRVGSSTKDIRFLVEEVRSAVNTTVMTTEGAAKGVEAGARQFSDVAAAFEQIASLIATTTDAAKEIELSTKQQSTAVEQINGAITNAAQASRESEASTVQTLQTASELASLAGRLLRLVRSRAAVTA